MEKNSFVADRGPETPRTLKQIIEEIIRNRGGWISSFDTENGYRETYYKYMTAEEAAIYKDQDTPSGNGLLLEIGYVQYRSNGSLARAYLRDSDARVHKLPEEGSVGEMKSAIEGYVRAGQVTPDLTSDNL